MKINNLKFKIRNYTGFTLIELLVVISIIGILAAITLVSFTSSQRQANDTRRKSDLSQYRTLTESFANKNNGLFPLYSGSTAASGSLCTTLTGVAGSCPEDPKYSNDSTYQYKYQSDGSGATGAATATKYVLWALLENIPSTYWVVCSTGQAGRIVSSTTFSGGACPSGLTQ